MVDVFVESAGVTVSVRGDRTKPAILTYHDLGLNAVSNFQAFSNFPEVGEILKNFCVYNVNAPGMEENAQSWPEEEPYPDMDQLADQVGTMRTFSLLAIFRKIVGPISKAFFRRLCLPKMWSVIFQASKLTGFFPIFGP